MSIAGPSRFKFMGYSASGEHLFANTRLFSFPFAPPFPPRHLERPGAEAPRLGEDIRVEVTGDGRARPAGLDLMRGKFKMGAHACFEGVYFARDVFYKCQMASEPMTSS